MFCHSRSLLVLLLAASFSTASSLADDPAPTGRQSPSRSCIDPMTAARAASLAQWVYQPSVESLDSSFCVVQAVHDTGSGLHAELLEEKSEAIGSDAVRPRLVVVVRGSEFDLALSNPSAAAADFRGYFSGGKTQWEALRDPMSEQLKSKSYREVLLIGHSLGGMVVQLAAAHLGEHSPETPVVAWMFNSPGVDRIADSIAPRYRDRKFPQVVLNHVRHADDPAASSRQFGEHHPDTRGQVVETRFTSPHSITELSGHLLAASGP